MVFADAGIRLAARLAVSLADAWRHSFFPFSASSPYRDTLVGELAQRMAPGVPLPGRPLRFIETLLTLMQSVLASQSPHLLLTSAALHLLTPDSRPEKGGATPWSELAALTGNKPALEKALKLALDETRRCEPPLALIERYAHGAQTICGVTVPDHCPVFAMVASGNRDDAVFGVRAEEFHSDRAAASDHLSLGHGIHQCAGQYVQEKLMPAALSLLIETMPDLRLSNPAARPAWHPTIYFRLLQALPVARCPP
jgi:cytochrome P450